MEILRESSITKTANDSYSSVENPPELPSVDLLRADRLPSLATAFLEGRDLDLLEPLSFLNGPNGEPWAERESRPDRLQLAAAMALANEAYGHSAAETLANKLAQPTTKVVVTGQQPGLFGGPLYTLTKAVAAQLWAEELERQGHPTVAVFWMATEDHDFKESAEVAFYTSGGPVKVSLGPDPDPLVPVGLRQLGPEIERVMDELDQAIPGDRFAEWLQALRSWYRPEAGFGEAFAQLMTNLLGERCPLLIDALLPELKQAEIPLMRQIVVQRQELAAAFDRRDRELTDRGYALQIQPQTDASPLFVLHDNQRRRVVWRTGDRVGLRGLDDMDEPVEWLLDLIEQEPSRVSPGARARVAIQDALFGTDVLVLGPGEMSYLPQAAPLYDLLNVPGPGVALRPQGVVLEEHQLQKLARSGVSLEQITDPSLDLDKALASHEETEFLRLAEKQLEDLLQSLKNDAEQITRDLEKPWTKTRDQMNRALEAFSKRVTAAISRRDETARGRAEALRQICRPLGKGQERVIASAHFPGKYRDGFTDALFEQLGLDPRLLRAVRP